MSYKQCSKFCLMYVYLFHPHFICPIPSALYHTAGKRGDIFHDITLILQEGDIMENEGDIMENEGDIVKTMVKSRALL